MAARSRVLSPSPAPPPVEERPGRTLHVVDAIALIVGVVVGAMVFRAPSLVAGNVSSATMFVGVWAAGGVASLIGALCYGELATAFPSVGGDYHFLRRAFGGRLAFLFAWARATVIQSGSIALLAFVFGDYAAELFGRPGPAMSGLWAAVAIVALTALNLLGLRQGVWVQRLLALAKVLGLGAIVVAGLLCESAPGGAPAASPSHGGGSLGLAMVLVLLTYGGWNEAAYVSAELKDTRRGMLPALIGGVGLVTLLYVLVNLAYLRVLGLEGVAGADAVAMDVGRVLGGGGAAAAVGSLVVVCALGSLNATVFTGARTCYAVGADSAWLGRLGKWDASRGTPAAGFVAQGSLALALVALGSLTRGGVQAMVDYTAPVFWFFFLLVGISLIVLRVRERDTERPFRVPLYPLTPLAFCGVCGYMLWSSVSYAVGQVRVGDPVSAVPVMAGILVLVVGVPLALRAEANGRRRSSPVAEVIGAE